MSDLSPQPSARTEEPELRPGGADALPLDPDGEGLGRDLPPNDNPAVDEVLPDEIAEPDDHKDQAPTGEADQEAGTETDEGPEGPEAGQVDEEGSPEPPA